MNRTRFAHLPQDRASELNIHLLIVEAMVEHTRSTRPVAKSAAQTSGTFLAVRSSYLPAPSTQAA
jgi:hypothetical protein